MDSMIPFWGTSKKVLLLGSGFVARPTVDILSKEGISVTVACRTLASAEKLAEGLSRTSAISLDVNDEAVLEHEVGKHGLVISLIPYIHHVKVIKAAIKQKKHVVTTSYVSPAMMELDEEAKEAGITVMNEIGLDPGLDHLYAVKMIDEVHKKFGRITSFLSYCGGLPAPECSDNPLGYKFSWSSRGVLLALRNPAKYYKDGKIVEVESQDLMGEAKPYHLMPAFNLVGYPNRDCTSYRYRYNMPDATDLVRGTLRYGGFPQFVKVLVDMGFLSEEEQDFLQPSDHPLLWKEATAKILGEGSNAEHDLISAIKSKASFADEEEEQRIIAGLRWIGLFSDEFVDKKGTPLDCLCAVLEKKCQYEEGERDAVYLQHKFGIEWSDGKKEVRTSTLIEYGDPKGYSAMAKLVGVPCAVAVLKVLDGTISEHGILAPMKPEINDPLIKDLKEKYGIFLKEKTVA
ncbi:saccharopine dehydrogenase (NADP+, L-glutamate-forming) [Coniosporium apollinis]|uniref:Saccharopine dehydrogenase (NADP+, L-glutamate-forming) n=2 Tax=Coniosporium TaxID=2810619 RepID=A0ABQ9NJD6_9PEZI|nr:saccharopine dehydrogenase (NADP+, L-glutamate-forming) [Cladosporium sp. JES 115]KAJ9659214.1 saccharopine dehydrogenase (NADP+, L-glutamate-forming) [Coniosporium apollinis]